MKLYAPFPVYCHYRDRLSKTEQADYDAIRDAVLERRKVVPVDRSSNARKLFLMVKNDRPYTFHTSLGYATSHTALYPHYVFAETAMSTMLEDVIRETECIHKILRNEPSVFRKVRRIHDMLCLSVRYSLSDETNNLAGALLFHRSACLGISHAFKFLCDRERIPSIVAWSNQQEQKPGHAWNLVQLEDGKWYGVDVTNDIGDLWDSGLCRHDYFLVSQDELSGSHIPACPEALPVIHDYHVYKKENCLVNSDIDVKRILSGMCGKVAAFQTTKTYTPSEEQVMRIAKPFIKGEAIKFFHNLKPRTWYIKM